MIYKLLQLLYRPWFLFGMIWIIIAWVYYPSHEAKFVSDYLQWVTRYKTQGWQGITTSYGDVSLKYGYHFLMHGAYTLFGEQSVLWHLFMTGIHALNATLLFVFIKKLMEASNIYYPMIALIGSLFFAFSPFHTETIAWAASIHFLFMPLLILTSLILFLKYVETSRLIHVLLISVLFIIGIYTTEAITILPVLISFLGIFLYLITKVNFTFAIKKVLTVALPLLLIIAAFFWHTQATYGTAVGHYGAETHLKIDIPYIIGNYIKYHLKFFTFFPLLPIEHFAYLPKMQGKKAMWLSVLWIIIIGVLIVRALYTRDKKWLFLLFLYGCFVVSLLPVINLENQSIHSVQTDRYSYIAGTFAATFIASIFIIFFKKIQWFFICIFLVASVLGLYHNVQTWAYNGHSFNRLLQSFPLENKGENIYILSLADSYKGAYQFRNGLMQGLAIHRGKPLNAHLVFFGFINALAPNDSVRVTPQGDQYHVIVGDWGRWFQFYGNATDDSTVRFYGEHGGYEYKFQLARPLGIHDKVIYQSGDQWTDVSYLFRK